MNLGTLEETIRKTRIGIALKLSAQRKVITCTKDFNVGPEVTVSFSWYVVIKQIILSFQIN